MSWPSGTAVKRGAAVLDDGGVTHPQTGPRAEDVARAVLEAAGKPDLVGASEVAEILGVAQQNVRRVMETAGIAPEYERPPRKGGRLWNREEVEEFKRNPPAREPRSHCSNGHEMTPRNTSAQGRCKRCEAERVAKYKASQAAQPDDKGTGR